MIQANIEPERLTDSNLYIKCSHVNAHLLEEIMRSLKKCFIEQGGLPHVLPLAVHLIFKFAFQGKFLQ